MEEHLNRRMTDLVERTRQYLNEEPDDGEQDPQLKPLWRMKKKPLSNKPKEERILEMITRIVSKIQNDKRNCL